MTQTTINWTHTKVYSPPNHPTTHPSRIPTYSLRTSVHTAYTIIHINYHKPKYLSQSTQAHTTSLKSTPHNLPIAKNKQHKKMDIYHLTRITIYSYYTISTIVSTILTTVRSPNLNKRSTSYNNQVPTLPVVLPTTIITRCSPLYHL